MVNSLSEIQIDIIAVKKINEYIQLPSEVLFLTLYFLTWAIFLIFFEADWENHVCLPIHWPSSGSVVFDNYCSRYNNNVKLSLKNINCFMGAKEKIGIVGRTGAGKSSLVSALFRLVEPMLGSIFIDGIDISTIGLHSLRKRLAIISQDPVLFSGTLRFNLDPFGQYTDIELWDALDRVNLKLYISETLEKLECIVFEGGSNFR